MTEIGYLYLKTKLEAQGFKHFPHWSSSYSIDKGVEREVRDNGKVTYFYRKNRKIPQTDISHLAFGLQNEGFYWPLIKAYLGQIFSR